MPAAGYNVVGIQVKTLSDGKVTTYNGQNWFKMPADDVSVTVLMEAKVAASSLSLEEPEALVLAP